MELLVVILGISIAFGIENYAANRKQKAEELRHLQGIVDDLETDLGMFKEFAGYTDSTLKYVRRFNQLIYARETKNDSINFLLIRAGWISNYDPRNISYNSLKASGNLDKLTNFDLRKRIVGHYEHKMKSVYFQNDIHERYLEARITPIQLKYSDFTSATKVERDFFNHREIRNVFAGLEGQLVNKYDNYIEAMGFTKEILDEVKAEIKKF
jgi:hypothetical protein